MGGSASRSRRRGESMGGSASRSRRRGESMNSRAARTGGEWIVDALRTEGVRHVFGIPGVHNLAIYDALIRQSEVTHVLARHEAGAAFMADGYARASGAPGVVVVTTGPGATNALTPLVESYAGSIPVVVVMSDVASPLVGRDIGALHEVPNQIECFKPVTRWAEAVNRGGGGAGDSSRSVRSPAHRASRADRDLDPERLPDCPLRRRVRWRRARPATTVSRGRDRRGRPVAVRSVQAASDRRRRRDRRGGAGRARAPTPADSAPP